MGRHPLHEERGHDPFIEAIGQVEKLGGGIVPDLGIAAQRRDGVGDAIAGLEFGETFGHALDDADRLEPDHHRAGRHPDGMGDAPAVVGVGEVQAHRRVPYADLARLQIGHRPLFPLHGLGRPYVLRRSRNESVA
jgi:hypothetical protein